MLSCRMVLHSIWVLQKSSRKLVLLHNLVVKEVWSREYFIRKIDFLLILATNIPRDLLKPQGMWRMQLWDAACSLIYPPRGA